MRLWKGIACSLVVVLFCSAAPKALGVTHPASGYTDDNVESTLRNALNRNPALGGVESNVLHGTVTLTGEVSHYQDKLDAEAIAHEIPGVSTVQNRISINAPVVDDAELEDRLGDRLRFARADIGLTFPQIQVEAHRGIVALTGSVKDSIEHAAALSIVGTTDGVLAIKDGLSIDPDLLTDEVSRARVNKAVYRAMHVSGEIGIGGAIPVHATFTGGTVILIGAVSDAKAKEDLLSRVHDASGAISVDDQIIVRNSTPATRDTSLQAAPCTQRKEVANAGN